MTLFFDLYSFRRGLGGMPSSRLMKRSLQASTLTDDDNNDTGLDQTSLDSTNNDNNSAAAELDK